jgi:hypothetical protein
LFLLSFPTAGLLTVVVDLTGDDGACDDDIMEVVFVTGADPVFFLKIAGSFFLRLVGESAFLLAGCSAFLKAAIRVLSGVFIVSYEDDEVMDIKKIDQSVR